MPATPFPARPCDVVALTASEFTCELPLNEAALFDTVCRRFLEDANRALVWLIRFRALTAWCERGDIDVWLRSDPSRMRHAREVAAGFDVNTDWAFDSEAFRCAVDSVAREGTARAQPVPRHP